MTNLIVGPRNLGGRAYEIRRTLAGTIAELRCPSAEHGCPSGRAC
jgi:hypothetical protein